MKPFPRSYRSVAALRAEFPEDQPGSAAFSRDWLFLRRIAAHIVVAASIPLQRLESPDARTLISLRTRAARTTLPLIAANPTPILSPLGS
jgi:hypothetical protein